jgi:hypothetical protein
VRPVRRKSLTFRLTVLFAAASTVVLLVLGLIVAESVEHHFEEQDMEALTGKLELIRHALAKVHSSKDLAAIPQQMDDSLIGHHGLVVAVKGRMVAPCSPPRTPLSPSAYWIGSKHLRLSAPTCGKSMTSCPSGASWPKHQPEFRRGRPP